MNSDLKKLQPYPFEKLNVLKGDYQPTVKEHIALSIGEPKHAAPAFVLKTISNNLNEINRYPLTKGSADLRIAIANWLTRRFKLLENTLDPEQHILPVNGTREALFSFAQCFVDRNDDALILMPNPFYQIYEGAAFLSGAEPYFYNTVKENNYLPDFDIINESIWQRCQIIYICTPGNPTGSVISKQQLIKLIKLSQQYDFIIASDECYSEIYFDENNPPTGLLEAAEECGNTAFTNCMIFHSLSKRSNLPGMRSGFVAGDARLIKTYLLYRTYHGSAMPPVHQIASIAAWNDEEHVKQNRKLYVEKFAAVIDILRPAIKVTLPDAGFYLWLNTAIDDEIFARDFFQQQNVTVLPGSYLSRENDGINPGKNHLRLALVAPIEECITAANRIKQYIQTLDL
ncbi:N-succinyl-L,L-diaminopimelate aminotransferase, type 2 [hydrothermal vent metagenome]|uniref:N-succinyl-L,L-diaminopimelate aminotransferase, type 2 n=1 Tax=hydrothermal vent metagenome TaxID=652676 RepID=A0A3B0WII0_9ZZZZ